MVSAVVPDLVSTPDADVLVPVLAHLASPVVLVLDAEETVVAAVVFAAETVSLLLRQILLSGYTMFGALIGIVSSNPYQHLSFFLALPVMPDAAVPLHS